VTCGPQESAGGVDGQPRLPLAQERQVESADLVADQFVDHSVGVQQHPGGGRVEAVHQGLNSEALARSASVVDPRASAKSSESSTSTPPRYFVAYREHVVQKLGFFSQGWRPSSLH